jgi:hypothetical protein
MHMAKESRKTIDLYDGGIDPWTWITEPTRLGYSAFNANSISGVRKVLATSGETCGGG